MDYVEQRMAQEAQRPAIVEAAFLTPLNIILLLITFYTFYATFFSSSSNLAQSTLPKDPPPIVFRTYTPRTLLPYNGTDLPNVYLAVRGRVFDVTPGKNFYGPGGPYENFAGRDASRGLACGSFDEDMLTKNLDGPLDGLEELGSEEMEALEGWEERFLGKYLVVGRLVAIEGEGEKGESA